MIDEHPLQSISLIGASVEIRPGNGGSSDLIGLVAENGLIGISLDTLSSVSSFTRCLKDYDGLNGLLERASVNLNILRGRSAF